MTIPPVPAKLWVAIPSPKMRRLTKDKSIEIAMNWPSGVLAVLRFAFASGVGRFQGWIGERDNAAVTQAAAIYKRGVATRKNGVRAPRPQVFTGRYPISVETPTIDPRSIPSDSPIIIDRALLALYPQWCSYGNRLVAVDCHETLKSLETAVGIVDAVHKTGCKGTWFLVGGGILTDMGGFAAAAVGRSFVMVPTTLLAMVDASLGGKTGVNFPPFGKNQIGLFAFPAAVHIGTTFLNTLSPREFRSGGAECVKHALLTQDARLLKRAVAAVAKREATALVPILNDLIQVKARVVAKDPTERGVRVSLNLGHTLGHALEALSHACVSPEKIIMHGEAIGVGLVYSLLLSSEVRLMTSATARRLCNEVLRARVVPSRAELIEMLGERHLTDGRFFGRVYDYILGDKKRSSHDPGVTEWILLKGQGNVAKKKQGWLTPVERDALFSTWKVLVEILPRA